MALREFSDSRGRLWRVWEVRAPEAAPVGGGAGQLRVRGEYQAGWLAFECEAIAARRRLVPIPEGWADGSEEQLRRWCADARRLTPRSRLIE